MWCPNPDCRDAVRYGVPAEFRDGVTTCVVCGSALTPARPALPPRAAGRHGGEGDARFDAGRDLAYLAIQHVCMLPVVEAELDAVNVTHRILNEGVAHLFGAGAISPVTGPPVLVVSADDLALARGILDGIEAAFAAGPDRAPENTPTRCRICGAPMDYGEYDAPRSICPDCITAWL